MLLLWSATYLLLSTSTLAVALANSGPTVEDARANRPIQRDELEQKQIKETCPPYGVYSKHRQ